MEGGLERERERERERDTHTHAHAMLKSGRAGHRLEGPPAKAGDLEPLPAPTFSSNKYALCSSRISEILNWKYFWTVTPVPNLFPAKYI